jgi:S-adenosylmethionine:tRNA ribosyltransferase-isomerase
MDFEKFLKFYDYSLPSELIARKPATPRDSAKLLVYPRTKKSLYFIKKNLGIDNKNKQTKDNFTGIGEGVYKRKIKEIFFDRFSNLAKYLPEKAVLVLNDTKVLPARLIVKKETGGLARILYVGKKSGLLEFLSDRNLNIGSKISVNLPPHLILKNNKNLLKKNKNIDNCKVYSKNNIRCGGEKLFFIVKEKVGSHYFLKPSFPISKIFEVLEKHGITPIPPYIKNSPLSEKELRKEYQTIFAAEKGSVAAPTASLHFTKRLLNKIKKSGRKIVFVTLHVNLGTFSPLSEEFFRKSKLHTEYYEISKESAKVLNKAKKKKFPIIAVGTTVVRALESAAIKGGKLGKLRGETDIFIKEGYKFKFVDGLITNFHVPKSSLLMLVSAFVGRRKLLELYKKAISKKFRFFSFGDGMLILD